MDGCELQTNNHKDLQSYCQIGTMDNSSPISPPTPSPSVSRSSSLTTDVVNEYRTARVADILSDFRTLQYYIAAAPSEPPNTEDFYTEGWAALRQCSLDGQHILNCAADTSVPQTAGGEEEQVRAELKQ